MCTLRHVDRDAESETESSSGVWGAEQNLLELVMGAISTQENTTPTSAWEGKLDPDSLLAGAVATPTRWVTSGTQQSTTPQPCLVCSTTAALAMDRRGSCVGRDGDGGGDRDDVDEGEGGANREGDGEGDPSCNNDRCLSSA